MQAAAALGMPAVALTCGGTSAAELRGAGAVEVYESPRDLLENLQESAIGALLAASPPVG
jgi:phosphoglycolate phosphatase-like HAD superfamily hydrolase